MNKRVLEAIKEVIHSDNIYTNEPMCKHTTFKIGGNADIYVKPQNTTELSKIIKICNLEKEDYFILGNGSNLLVADDGYRGVVIQMYNNYNNIEIKEHSIVAEAGALMSKIANVACENELTGLEFSAGIPGTIGGGAMMNAGAYGGELKDVITKVEAVSKEGELYTLDKADLEFGYRTSIFEKNNSIVTKVTIELNKGIKAEIKAKMDELSRARISKQPLEYPSAGSTFKRPEGYFAGKLIMDAGLRGKQIGGAKVSDKHCGFIINAGGATAKDVMDLIDFIIQKVYADFGVRLETEVKKLGSF